MRCCELFDVEPFPVILTEVSNANEVKGSRTASYREAGTGFWVREALFFYKRICGTPH